jgi:hypothetical protein
VLAAGHNLPAYVAAAPPSFLGRCHLYQKGLAMTAVQLIEALEAGHAIAWRRNEEPNVPYLYFELEKTPSGARVLRLGGWGAACFDRALRMLAVIEQPEEWVIGEVPDEDFRKFAPSTAGK